MPVDATLTDVLLAPAAAGVEPEGWARVRDRLVAGLVDAAAGRGGDVDVEVGVRQLRRARYRPELLGLPEEPFAWKPAFVRRSLGIAAVRACAEGRFRGPAEAVGPLADGAVEEWRRSGWRSFHWEPWFAGLGAGGRAPVLADAITWATPVWAAFDWARLAPSVELGGPDDRWSAPGPGPVRLRGRSEARVARSGRHAAGGGVTGLVSVSGGRSGDGYPEELAFLALVAGLASPAGSTPARVVGLWPEAAEVRVVEIDESALDGAVDRVVDTVAVMADVAGVAPTTAVA